jgi:hypothetical protein
MSVVDKFIELGLSHVGGGYVYGTNGDILTEALLQNRMRLLDPLQTGSFRPKYMAHIRKNYMGKYVADCSGLIVSICRDLGLDKSDYSASRLYYYQCDRKPISEIERGDLVFKKNSTSGKVYHVGIYLGDNEVLEAQGTMYGIRVNKLSSSWTLAGRLKVFGNAKAEPAEPEKPYTGIYEVNIKDTPDNYLNIRDTPSGHLVARLAPHDFIKGLGQSEYKDGLMWVKVEPYNLADATGWVAEKYLKRIDELPAHVADALRQNN